MPIIYNAATTLNGFLADDHDSLQWLFDVPGSDDAAAETGSFLDHVDALVMGSTTYEWLLKELGTPEEIVIQHGGRPIWVFSSRELPLPESSDTIRLLNGAVADHLPLIRKNSDTIWVMGGGDLAGQFFDAGALDKIILTLAPVFLPSGRPTLPRSIDSSQLTFSGQRQVGKFVEVTLDVTPTP